MLFFHKDTQSFSFRKMRNAKCEINIKKKNIDQKKNNSRILVIFAMNKKVKDLIVFLEAKGWNK